MSRPNDLEIDETLRTAWAASAPASQHLDEEMWKAFFEGRLDADVREATLEHVSSCSQCASVFKAARSAALAQVPPVRSTARRLMPALAFAATVTVAIATVVLLRQPTTVTAPARSIATPAPQPSAPLQIEKPAVVISGEQLIITRSDRNQTAYLETLAKALEPYQNDQFAEAARMLAPIAQDHPDRFEPAFYLGASLLLDRRPQEAVPVLERAQALASAARKDEATRLLELARSTMKQP